MGSKESSSSSVLDRLSRRLEGPVPHELAAPHPVPRPPEQRDEHVVEEDVFRCCDVQVRAGDRRSNMWKMGAFPLLRRTPQLRLKKEASRSDVQQQLWQPGPVTGQLPVVAGTARRQGRLGRRSTKCYSRTMAHGGTGGTRDESLPHSARGSTADDSHRLAALT